MTSSGGARPADGGGAPPWSARVRRPDGTVAGAGVLVAEDLVLARAGEPGGGRCAVEFPGVDLRPVPARVEEADRRPADGGGPDLALLRLDAPRPPADPARPCRTAVVRRAVLVHGGPAGPAHAEVVPGTGDGGRVRLRRADPAVWSGDGWPGAGAVDAGTGALVGVVHGDPHGPARLVPTETVLRHLPELAGRATGPAALPDGWLARPGDRIDDATAARWFAGWAAEHGRPVVLGVLADGGSRLLLAFHDQAADSRRRAATDLTARARHAQLLRIRARLTDVAFLARTGVQDRMARVAPTGTARLRAALTRAASARAHLAEPPGPSGGAEPEDLGPYERLADQAWQRAADTIEELDVLITRRDDLRGALAAWRVLETSTARSEEPVGAALYLAAHEQLYRGPCEVDRAAEAVARYTAHVLRTRGASPGAPEGERPEEER